MQDPRTAASWALAPHSAAKLGLLGAYLQPWFAILGQSRFKNVVYIDGFAGPGRYTGGEDGSPLVALKALAAHGAKLQAAFEFHLVEREKRTAEALKANIEELRQQGLISPNTAIKFYSNESFENAYVRAIAPRLAQLDGAPAFALVDPFGWTGIPMRIMADLMMRPRTELLVNFMFEEINRFLSHKDQHENFDELFGCEDWRQADTLSGQLRKQFLHDLYRGQLQTTAKARYTRSFEMINERGFSDYFLFFATRNLRGLEKMKEAMWHIDPAGGTRFSDATDFNQHVLFEPKPDMHRLRRAIEKQFSGKRATVGDVQLFVLEETAFHTGHYKRVLKVMESTGYLTPVEPPPKRRSGTYSDPNLVLYFSPI